MNGYLELEGKRALVNIGEAEFFAADVSTAVRSS
jgi:hypothetical protein